jgi:hypothetical protein
MEDESLMSLPLLLAPSPVQSRYALSHMLIESHHRCDGRQSLCVPSRRRLERLGKGEEWLPVCVPSRRRSERLGKGEEWLPDQNIGAEKRKVATKVRSRLGVLKRDRVKIILVVK